MSHPIEQLESIMAKLRDPKTGCPWDSKQTFETIVPHTIEETYEVADAIHSQDWAHLKEELGDLLFQVIFYAQMAKEQQWFDFSDVVETLNEKLVRRHPHVFDEQASRDLSDEQLNAQWQQIKQQEKALKATQALSTESSSETGVSKDAQSILDSIPASMPPLLRATKMQKACAKVGFDWDSLGPVVDKVQEEVQEVVDEAVQVDIDQDALELEIGDLLFAVVNLSRHLGKNPDQALLKANQKFESRFRKVEMMVQAESKTLKDYNLDQLDGFWNRVKQQESGKTRQ
ncbi:nucleoside triphosphate pyrophosphohydrolase [Vibrio ulleungensis]|uniref:Nucleoside triphosphate pyrophosphohydrolase n=1 Tax=Vibrio ulleungensis TaxID=2807619 RepID=A0ABS2HK79_9VIBR|nr:nucleoside triphosphate pyrophosphohydrolase [Vibrio ulleungensis]MBM7037893.1 nucleoside triphosphate pyrophosphohydrolase [Vibrio ulleungensis]